MIHNWLFIMALLLLELRYDDLIRTKFRTIITTELIFLIDFLRNHSSVKYADVIVSDGMKSSESNSIQLACHNSGHIILSLS